MKSRPIVVLCLFLLAVSSCTKKSDAGIQIDGNGKPIKQSAVKDTSVQSEYGIVIDPDGRH